MLGDGGFVRQEFVLEKESKKAMKGSHCGLGLELSMCTGTERSSFTTGSASRH